MSIVSFMAVRTVEVAVVLLLILFMPSIPPKANFTEFKVTPSRGLEGKLAVNERLNNVEHIFEDELIGAEAFVEYNGELYTSLGNGDVVKISNGHIVPVVKFGKPCAGYFEEAICGRPLGLTFDKNGVLYVADAYMGIWKVDVGTGKKTLLVSMEQEIEEKRPKIPNSLTVSENGDIYWTDSSTEFYLNDGVFTLLADGSGRVIHYDAKTKTNKVLMNGLNFANGIILSAGEEFLVISETATSRLYRYYLKGPKKGTHDIFLDGLPGLPDNINSDGKDGFLIPLFTTRDAENPVITQTISRFPSIRKLAARLLGLTKLGFQTVERIYPNTYTKIALFYIGNFKTISFLMAPRASILHVSKSGEILDSMHGNDQTIAHLSDATIFGDHLYIGSPINNYVGRIPLDKVGLSHLRRKRAAPSQSQTPPVKKTTAPPVKQTPPPTAAPVKRAPVTQAPPPAVKQAPSPPTAVPVKKVPPPTATPVKQAPSPTVAPVKQAPAPKTDQMKQAPVKQAPVSKEAPVKQAPVSKEAPVKQPPVSKEVPVKQAPVSKEAPVKQAPVPKTVPVKQAPSPTAAPVKPAKKVAPATQDPVKKSPPTGQNAPKPAPVREDPLKNPPK